MTRWTRAAGLAVFLGGIASCGSGSKNAAVVDSKPIEATSTTTIPTTTTIAPTTSPAPTTTVAQTTTTGKRALTPEELASVVASESDGLQGDVIDVIFRCGFDVSTCSVTDQLSAYTFTLTGSVLAQGLQKLKDVGTVPASMIDLVDRTIKDGRAVSYAGGGDGKKMACGPGSASWPGSKDTCSSDYILLTIVSKTLEADIKAWKPYGA